MEGTKKCLKCKQAYPATIHYFYKDVSRNDGLTKYCKQCQNQYHNQYYRKHQKRIIEYNEESKMSIKSKCCGVEPSSGKGFFYVTPTLLPRIRGNPFNLPKPTFVCSKCGKECEIEETTKELAKSDEQEAKAKTKT